MTKVTLNEVEYDTENFDENQISMLNEVIIIKRKLEDIDYDKALYSSRSDLLIKSLEDSLKEIKEETND